MKLKVLLMCVLVVLVSGCAKTKKALSPDEFSEILSKFDYQIIDKTDAFDYAEAAYYVNTESFQFIYINGKRKYDIEGLFVEECKNIVSEVGKVEYQKEIDNGDNFAKLQITTEDMYYYISWVDDTYIYIKAPLRSQSKLENIIDELGY